MTSLPACTSIANATAAAQSQYKKFKEHSPNFVLLFQIGDAYIAFEEDAKIVDRITSEPIKVDNVEIALRKLIQAGYRVALCDPLR